MRWRSASPAASTRRVSPDGSSRSRDPSKAPRCCPVSATAGGAVSFPQRRGHTGGLGLIEQELAPNTGRADVLPGSPCLAKRVDDEQPEAAWGLGVRREHARSQA
jgi:hypothetical protein